MRTEPLIVTATPNVCWLHPEVPYPRTTRALIEEAQACQAEGATILHFHAEDRWVETIAAVRDKTDLLVQCGMSSLAIPDRMEVFRERADMISIILSHHDEAFADVEMHALHPRDELVEYCKLASEYSVKLELEIWHTGSLWNLKYLINAGVISPPYITTLFFGWPGGSWSPPTIEEYLYRRAYVPDGAVVTVSVMGEQQIDILTAAILRGDHVRVGTEDYPCDRSGSLVTTSVLVKEAAQLAHALGRPLATPQEARGILGIEVR